MDNNLYPKTKKEISIHMMDKENGFLTNAVSGDVYQINYTSKMIIEKCNGSNSVTSIVQAVLEMDSEHCLVSDDIIEILKFMVDEGICTVPKLQ